MPTTSDRGLFVWHELNTTDLGAAEAFYSRLIGWKGKPWDPNPNYRIWSMGRDQRAGLYLIHEQPNLVTPPPHWLNYIGTPDVDATVRQAVELGGKVATPAGDVPGVGRSAVLQDPQGAMFAVFARVQRTKFQEPEIGDFSWHELLTSNWQTAFEFYSKLFAWEKMMAMDMGAQGTYQIFGVGGHQLGGMFNPGGLPGGPLWLPYIHVRDARKTAEAAKELGAMIAHGPIEVPGGDWVFTGIDRQGAMFAVHSRKRAVTKDTAEAAPKDVTTTSTRTGTTKGAKAKGAKAKGMTAKGMKAKGMKGKGSKKTTRKRK
jgi:predicted enzyme related to lactoylglutathione lyase